MGAGMRVSGHIQAPQLNCGRVVFRVDFLARVRLGEKKEEKRALESRKKLDALQKTAASKRGH